MTDIAGRAEVGRTTFFRYFGDKQEVLFADSEETAEETSRMAGRGPDPIGASMSAALEAARRLVLSYVEHITADADAYRAHQRLINGQPELYARSLVKQRSYAEKLTAQLERWGADPPVARQAAETGLACFYAGQATASDDPRLLARDVGRAYDRLTA